MTRHLFRHLRRCRALFALALCAWLALGSAAWAQPEDCCASMAASMGMSVPHAPDHGAAHSITMAADGCCAHASVSVPPSSWGPVAEAEPASQGWLSRRETAPQPVYEPPLRPPVA
ncbi:hypothetical protein [Dyella jiangningensis]|uniref:DUF2946 domain-containing protein n=1 Tax=Dyella jiangningensis TaxID=1379159 RepID=A0A328P7H9_9GAMM|nr:hypothetical protein [Dyella jiangningensis]RAO77600.1 hypothetical protein CA260_06960 [Dyella jiangningensis]